MIVGGGPVGLACATELGLRGVRCAVVEPQTSLHRIPKGQNLMQRSLEHFARWGCVDELRAARVMPRGYPIGGLVAYRNFESSYWHAPPGRERLARYFAESNERLPQYLTEAVLRERVSALATVDTFYGFKATGISQDELGVTVRFKGADDEADEGDELRADYVIGCDGGGSLVREQAGIEFVRFGRAQTMVLAVFRSKEFHEQLERFPQRTTYRAMHPELEGYWRMFGRVDVGETFFFHGPIPDTDRDSELDGAALLAEAAGFPFACEFEYLARWQARVAIAANYRDRRVFIAGDACHIHPPYGGFGLNTGLEDAVNLGWKLAATLQGWGGDALLDTYDLERRPVFTETAEQVINAWIEHDRQFLERYSPDRDLAAFKEAWNSEMAVSDSGPAWYEPHYEGSPVVDGPRSGRCGVFGEYSVRARPGHPLAPCVLSKGGNSFDALGTGFTLLALSVDDQVPDDWTAAAQELGIPLTVERDTWEGERREWGSRLVLARPDRFVAWVGHDEYERPTDVLERVTGQARDADAALASKAGAVADGAEALA